MNTWLFTDYKGRFHTTARPWTTWHAPIIGPYFLKRQKVLSHAGPSATSRRGMTEAEARGYHHVYDERESETVTLTWPRTIPLREGDRGWADMAWIQSQLPRLAGIPIQLIWAPEDQVFPIEYAAAAEGAVAARRGADDLRPRRPLPAGRPRPGDRRRRRGVPEPRGGAGAVNFVDAHRGRARGACAPIRSSSSRNSTCGPRCASSLERALGFRAGRAYWKSDGGHLFAIELGDFGRGRPSMAIVYGFWPRYEPRPLDDEAIDDDAGAVSALGGRRLRRPRPGRCALVAGAHAAGKSESREELSLPRSAPLPLARRLPQGGGER